MVKKASPLVYVYVFLEGVGRVKNLGLKIRDIKSKKVVTFFLTGNLERFQRRSWFVYVNKRTTRLTSGGDNFVNAINHARKKPLLAGYVFT